MAVSTTVMWWNRRHCLIALSLVIIALCFQAEVAERFHPPAPGAWSAGGAWCCVILEQPWLANSEKSLVGETKLWDELCPWKREFDDVSVSTGCLCVRSASVTCMAVEGGPGALLAAPLLAALAATAPGDTLRGHGCGETPCLELILSRPFSHRAMGTRHFPSCVRVSRDLHIAFSMGATSEWVVMPSEWGGTVQVLLQDFADVWDFENTLQEECLYYWCGDITGLPAERCWHWAGSVREGSVTKRVGQPEVGAHSRTLTWGAGFLRGFLFCLVVMFSSCLDVTHTVHSSKSKNNLFPWIFICSSSSSSCCC